MQKPPFIAAILVAAAGVAFALPVSAETLDAVYSGAGRSAANTTAYCHEANDGNGCDLYLNANIWLTFEEPTEDATDITLHLSGASECNAGGTNIRVYVLSRAIEGNANSSWTQAVNGTTNWSTPGGDLSGSYVGQFDCSTSAQDIELTVPEGELDAFQEFHSLALVGTENYPNFASWYMGPTLRSGTYVTLSGGGGGGEEVEDLGMGKFLPQMTWAQDVNTGNGTATNTWSNKGSFVFGNATTTFPMCAAWKWLELFDVLAAATDGTVDPQAMTIQTNFGFSTSTYYVSTTSTKGTTDIPGFSNIVTMIHDWAQTIGWSLFGMQVLIVILTRKKESDSHD